MNAIVPARRRVQELDVAVSNFCAILTDEQRHDLSNIRNIPDADSIFVFTAQLDYENRSRRGQSVGSRVSKVLQSTRDYCTVIDTYVSSHPEIAALVWGSVRLTIQIVLNYTSYYEAISRLFLNLGHLCPLFVEYGALYPSSKQLQKSLSDFHASIVRCCKHAIEAIQRPWHTQVLQAFYKSFEQEFQPDLDDIRRCSESVKDAIHLAKAYVDAQEQKVQAKERTSASKHRDLLEADLKRRSYDRKQQLLEALCSHRPEKLLKQNQRKRFSNTASWIFEIAKFRRWIDTTESPVLWCSGKIGSGKTVVAASVVDYLFLEKGRSDCLVSYFFIHSSDQESLKAETIMKSILRQRLPPATQLSDQTEERLRHLSSDSDLDKIVTFLRDITNMSRPSYIVIDGLDECEKRDRVRLFQALASLVLTAANTKLFLAGRESLAEEIQTHFPTTSQILSMNNLNTQDDMAIYIHGILSEKVNMGELRVGDSGLIAEIENALTQGADGMFLWVFFQVQELCEQTCDEDIRHTIANLPEDLEETFRRLLRRILSRRNSELPRKVLPWIAAAVRPLSLPEVREAVAIELGQKYTKPERLCNNINSIISLCENLLHIDEEDGSVQFAHHSIRQFLVEQPVPPQQLSDDDLRAFHIDLQEADHFIGEICITYLHFSDFQTELSQLPKSIVLPNPQDIALTAVVAKRKLASKLRWKVLSREASISVDPEKFIGSSTGATSRTIYNNTHPFLKYAAKNWILHTKNFRDNRSKTWNAWKNIIISGHAVAVTPWQAEASNSGVHVHQWSIQAKHPAILYLIDRCELWRPTAGWDIIRKAIEDDDPARIGIGMRRRELDGVASYVFPKHPSANSLAIADRLLAAGADVDATNWDESVLEVAASYAYLHVVSVLLLTITLPSKGGRAFLKAVTNGHAKVVGKFLEAGADANADTLTHGPITPNSFIPNSLTMGHRTALSYAAGGGHLNIVVRLLIAGADVDVQCEGGKTALSYAAEGGHLNIVETLLTAGAHVNVPCQRGRTALSYAAERDYLDIVEKLLAAGADVKIPDEEGKTALDKADTYGFREIAERLLQPHEEMKFDLDNVSV